MVNLSKTLELARELEVPQPRNDGSRRYFRSLYLPLIAVCHKQSSDRGPQRAAKINGGRIERNDNARRFPR